ncbi:hypothetical protein [Pseudonocardia sp. HH130630-07]|uniref:hypothetical protein n=1 Tax=Pseudonocardia sp. HH130630-07 TaxID=1690815 RepID=UPI0012EA8DA5|nr:hypothetical protein [Pseudonocardia sp. HH130630-07]
MIGVVIIAGTGDGAQAVAGHPGPAGTAVVVAAGVSPGGAWQSGAWQSGAWQSATDPTSGVPAQEPSPPPPPPDESRSCGITDVSACVAESFTDMARSVVADVLNPALVLLSRSLLATPQLTEMPRVAELWGMSWQLMVTVYGLLIVAGGLLVMVHQTIQTRTGLRQVLPRLLVGFVAGAVSMPLCAMAIEVANALSRAAIGDGVDPVTGAGGLQELMQAAITGSSATGGAPAGLVASIFVLPVVVLVLAVLAGWVLRVAVTVLLIVAAPLALMWHALPQTEGVARWWWRALAGCLATQVLQSLVLIVGLRIMLVPGNFVPAMGAVPTGSGLVAILTVTVLLWILWKIPGWVWSSWIGGGGRGRSMLGALVRGLLIAKGAGLLKGALSAAGSRGGGTSSGRGRGPSGPSDPSGPRDPYVQAPTGEDGQTELPYGLRPRRRRRPPVGPQWRPRPGDPRVGDLAAHEPWDEHRRPIEGQMELPLLDDVSGDPRPVRGPTVGPRQWQWRLPMGAEPTGRPPRPDRGKYTYIPRDEPLRGPVAGQWAMPIPEDNPAFGPRPRRGPKVGPNQWQWRLPVPAERARPAPGPARGSTSAPDREPSRAPVEGQYEIPFSAAVPRASRARPRRQPQRSPMRGPDVGPDQWQWRLPVPAGRIPRDRRASRFVPMPGYREPADAGQVPRDYVAGERVADLPPRRPWAGGHRRGDGQFGLPIPAPKPTPPERVAYRFVATPGRPEPAQAGQIPADYVAHPQNEHQPPPVRRPPEPARPRPPRPAPPRHEPPAPPAPSAAAPSRRRGRSSRRPKES